MKALRVPFTTVTLILMSGCWLGDRGPRGYEYVLRKGGPREIVAWGTGQTDWWRMDDAAQALLYLVGSADSSTWAEAAEGYAALVRHVEEKPPTEVVGEPPTSGATTMTAMDLAERLYIHVSDATFEQPTNPRTHLLFMNLRPPRTKPDYLHAWEAEQRRLTTAEAERRRKMEGDDRAQTPSSSPATTPNR